MRYTIGWPLLGRRIVPYSQVRKERLYRVWFKTARMIHGSLSLSLPFTFSFFRSLSLFPPASHRIGSHRSDRFWQRHPKTRVSNKLLLVDKSDAILLWDYDVCTHRVGFIGHACTATLVIRAFRAPAVFYSARIPSVFATRADLCAYMVARFCNCIDRLRNIARRIETTPTRIILGKKHVLMPLASFILKVKVQFF